MKLCGINSAENNDIKICDIMDQNHDSKLWANKYRAQKYQKNASKQ